MNRQFTVGHGESVDFVFDITGVEAGKSGTFLVKPVVSESGTDVPFERVDGDDGDDAAELSAASVGNVAAGTDATVTATQNGSAVESATVSVDGEVVARTDASGNASVPVPSDAEELEVTVRAHGDAVTLELTSSAADERARALRSALVRGRRPTACRTKSAPRSRHCSMTRRDDPLSTPVPRR